MQAIIGALLLEFKFFFRPRVLLPDHDDSLDPGELGSKRLLQALDQGYSRHVSAPAEARWRDLDRSALDAGEDHIAHARSEPLGLCRNDVFDLVDILAILAVHTALRNPQSEMIYS